jgi:Domain of unknown function (DUF4148)
MQIKQIIALSALAIAAGSVFAAEADTSAPLTRAEVRQAVIDARAAGELVPAGQASDYPPAAAPSRSDVSRGELRQEVLQARADGSLRHAGEFTPEEQAAYVNRHAAPSTLTRAEVKSEVLQARAAGELMPAGEGIPTAENGPYAHASTPNRTFAGIFHRGQSSSQ